MSILVPVFGLAFLFVVLLGIKFWPITLVLFALLFAWEKLKQKGFTGKIWFMRINITSNEQDRLDKSRPLSEGDRFRFRRYCERTGTDIDQIRWLK